MQIEHIALVVIEMPDMYAQPNQMKWQGFLSMIGNMQQKPWPSLRLAECVWLFDLQSDLPQFVELMHASYKMALPSKVQFFSERPRLADSLVAR